MLARLPSLGWALSVAFIGDGSCFQPVGSPFARIDSRGRTTGAKNSPNFKTRRQHVSEAARVVRPDSSESGFGQARDRHGQGGENEEGGGRSPSLTDYFIRHSIESAEIVPAVDSGCYASGDAEAPAGVVFVKTVIFQADGKPFAAVMREDLVADRAKMARHLRLTSRQVTLAKAPYVEDVTGFPVGTIPPLGHRTRVPTLVDAELLKYSTIIGGAGLRGFDSRLSLRDLLKATGASVIPLARPRRLGDGGDGAKANNGGATAAKAPMLSWFSSSTATIPTSGFPTSVNLREEAGGDAIVAASFPGPGSYRHLADEEGATRGADDEGFESTAAAAAAARTEGIVWGIDPGRNGGSSSRSKSSKGSGSNGSSLLGGGGGGGDPAGMEAAGDPEAEATFRLISAAMQAVSAALSAISTLQDGGGSDRGEYAEGPALSPEPGTDAGTKGADGGEPSRGRENHQSNAAGAIVFSTAALANAEESAADRSFLNTANDTFHGGLGADREGQHGSAQAAAVTRTEAVLDASQPAPYGQELARVAGTPTVDAIGGDVHLVAIVAGKRSLTRLLHFVDLVPPSDDAMTAASNQTCHVRKAWMVPGMNPPGPVKVQLIMGKTLVDRLGQQEALVAMRGVKRGQLLYITGRPTPDTRAQYLGAPSTATTTPATHSKTLQTYDLVCCSVRMLEDAPLVEPELVGKGDEWQGGGDYLKMDLEESAVTYVDSAKRLKEMGDFLRKTLLCDDSYSAAAGTAFAAAVAAAGREQSSAGRPQMPALAIDCEWRPARVAGTPANPVCLMQLAAGERTYVVDMLHVLRPKNAPSLASPAAASAAAAAGETTPSGFTKTEVLLEEALGAVLGSPGVVKVGLGPKADFQSLVRSYPHMPCFRRVCGVVNLCHVASNASSLRGKPAEDKASLSRLCKLVLGKPLDKSEQCSDWGNRPLSGRQKRYAALDARATLLVHRQLAPQVPAERMESLFNTFAYDHRADGMVATQTLPSTQRSPAARGRAARQQKGGGSRGATGRMRKLRAGGSRQERMLRKQLLGVTMINVSGVPLDAEGLRSNWLGRALPGLTKEGAVRACIFPRGEMPTSGELPTVLRFDRHQSFVEFGNGYALLMNCGGSVDREHASGFLDEDGATAAWYLQGKLSSDAALVDSEAAEYQRQQQGTLRQGQQQGAAVPPSTGPASIPANLPGGERDAGVGGWVSTGRAAFSAGRGGGGGGGSVGDAIGKFLQKLAEASGTPSSMLGGLPEDDPPTFLEPQTPPPPPPPPRTGEEVSGLPQPSGLAGAGTAGQKDAGSHDVLQQTPHLVLFARAKGRPFVYCGAVDCIAQEYVWSAGSSLGAVRFTLALREWREAAAVAAAPQQGVTGQRDRSGGGAGAGEAGGGRGGASGAGGDDGRFNVGGVGAARGVYGEGNAFARLVEEGLRPPRRDSENPPGSAAPEAR
eukprot:g18115.t1